MGARNDLGLSAAFLQQRRRLQSTLPAADYKHFLAGKFSEVTMLGRVRCQFNG